MIRWTSLQALFTVCIMGVSKIDDSKNAIKDIWCQ